MRVISREFAPEKREDPLYEGFESCLNWIVESDLCKETLHILNLGCEDGALASIIDSHHELTLVDPDQELLDLASSRLSERKPECVQDDPLKFLSFTRRKWDAILVSFALSQYSMNEVWKFFSLLPARLHGAGVFCAGDLMFKSEADRENQVEYFRSLPDDSLFQSISNQAFLDQGLCVQELSKHFHTVGIANFSRTVHGLVARR